MVGQHVEQRAPDAVEQGVPVEVRGAVAPGRADPGGHDPVVDLGQRRVPVAGEAREAGPGRLHHGQVLDPGLDDGRSAPHGRRGRRPGEVPARRNASRDGPPSVGIGVQRCSRSETVARSTWGTSRKCPARTSAERLGRAVEVLGRERVDRVLHRVGRDDVGVVAVGVGGPEVALERDVHGQVADAWRSGSRVDLDQPDRGLAVAVRHRARSRRLRRSVGWHGSILPASRRRRGPAGAGRARRPPGGRRRSSGRRRSAASSPASAAAARVGGRGVGAAPSSTRSVAAARIGVGGDRPEREPDVAPRRSPGRVAPGERPARPCEIACARRVPTLRKRCSPAGDERDPDPEEQLVRPRAPSAGRPARTRPRRSVALAARPAGDELRVEGEQDRQRVAGRRRVHRRCRRSCRGSGSGPRRSSRRPRRAPARARRTAPIGGSRCTSSARRARAPRRGSRSRAARRAATGRAPGRAARRSRRRSGPAGPCRRASGRQARRAGEQRVAPRRGTSGETTGGSTGIGQAVRAAPVAVAAAAASGDRLDDLRVAGAAAEVAGDRLADRLVGRRRRRRRGTPRAAMSMPGRADAALGAAGLEERLLERAEDRAASRPGRGARPSTVAHRPPVDLADGHEAASRRPRRRRAPCRRRTRPRRSPPSCRSGRGPRAARRAAGACRAPRPRPARR